MSTELSMLEWRAHPEFPRYEVSNFGQVRHIKRKTVLKQHVNRHGRRGRASIRVRCNGKMKTIWVHCAVAELFIGERPLGMLVDHMDGNPLNNDVTNLRYVTHRENCQNRQWRLFPANVSEIDNKYRFRLEKGVQGKTVMLAKLNHTCLHVVVQARDKACRKLGFTIPDKLEDYPDLKCRCGACHLSTSLAQA